MQKYVTNPIAERHERQNCAKREKKIVLLCIFAKVAMPLRHKNLHAQQMTLSFVSRYEVRPKAQLYAYSMRTVRSIVASCIYIRSHRLLSRQIFLCIVRSIHCFHRNVFYIKILCTAATMKSTRTHAYNSTKFIYCTDFH